MKKRFGVGKSYSDILTILLVIIIIAIISLLGFFTYKMVNTKVTESNAEKANDEFLATAEENRKKIEKNKNEEEVDIPTEIDYDALSGIIGDNNNSQNSELPEEPTEPDTSSNNNVEIKKTYYAGYEVKGSISIPKTNCNYSILERVTVDSLSKSVALMSIEANPELNRTVNDLNVPGTNAFIMGHNYRNGQFFSNNDKLAIGDKIKITDPTGTQITYTIYDMFYTEEGDASFMRRDIDINTREITLQTCNEDSSRRLIILAKDN